MFRLASIANDWLHGNSLQLTPDGNILYSARHQDWLIKIDYCQRIGFRRCYMAVGKGRGFRVVSDDPGPVVLASARRQFRTRIESADDS